MHLALDRLCHAALLAGRIDFEAMVGRRIMSFVAGVTDHALQRDADLLFNLRDDEAERMAVIRFARQSLGVGDVPLDVEKCETGVAD